eukprot:8523784-Ditylum_brightwellii.AAC.1
MMTIDGVSINTNLSQTNSVKMTDDISGLVKTCSGSSPQGASSRWVSRVSQVPFDQNQANLLAMTRMKEIQLVELETAAAYHQDLNVRH